MIKNHLPISSLLLVILSLFTSQSWSASAPAETTRLAVQVTGLEGEELANVLNSISIARLMTREGLIDKFKGERVEVVDADARKLNRLHKAATSEIQMALQPFGYYLPKIKATIIQDEDIWRAQYDIDPGSPVIIEKLNLEISGDAAEVAEVVEARAASLLQPNTRLLHQNYTQTKASLLSSALDKGYLDSRFTKSALQINTRSSKAFIDLALDTGKQYFFGPVDIRQNILKRSFVEDYIPFAPGDPFNADQLIQLQLSLSDSDYFSRVEITANREDEVDYQIPIVVETEASKPRKYVISGGFGTDTGPRVKLGVQFRRINKRGHNIDTELLVSSVKKSATAQYEIPMGNAGSDNWRFISRYEDQDIADGESKKLLLGVNYSDSWRGLQRRQYLNYTREKFRFGSSETDVDFLMPGISLSYKKADNVLLPLAGYSWFVDVHGGTDSVISDTTFVQAKGVTQHVWSLNDRSRLLARLEFGATDVDSFDKLPASERFFAGGDRSVRGYKFQSLGPTDGEGNVIGGRYLATGGVEVDYLLYKDFGGALFYDFGDASSTTNFDWHRSLGLGFRWRSPVGMLKIDFASPLDDPEKDFRVHISIGADL